MKKVWVLMIVALGAVCAYVAVQASEQTYDSRIALNPYVPQVSISAQFSASSSTSTSTSASVSKFQTALRPSTQLAAVEGAGSGLGDWWKFDDGSGSAASDSTGGNPLTLASTTWTTGKIGGALSFDGSDSRASAGSDLIGAGTISVCAWYYANSTAFGGMLFSNNKFSVGISSSNNFSVTSDGVTTVIGTPNSITTGSWNYICVTRDTTGAATIYLNGISNVSGNSGTPAASTNAFTVGNHPWLNQGWNGMIDDVRLYSRVLSGSEVASIYSEGGGAVFGVNVTNSAAANGSVSSSPAGISCGSTCSFPNIPLGSAVTLTAVPNSGYSAEWTGCGSTQWSSACALTVNANTSVSVNFVKDGAAVAAQSCSQADVQTAINEVTDGGTITIPAGTCTWTQTVTADFSTNPRSVIIEGAGIGQTTIIDGDTARVPILLVTTAAGKAFRLTGFTFTGSPSVTAPNYNGTVMVSGNSQEVRVDHNEFYDVYGDQLEIHGSVVGVIDDNSFSNDEQGANITDIKVYDDTWNGGSYGDGSFADQLYLGTNKAMYVEGNTFSSVSPTYLMDNYNGARVVFRYNSVDNGYIASHGTESRQRGLRSFEIYGNTMKDTEGGSIFTPMFIRSGTGVIFDNTITGYNPWQPNVVDLIDYRTFEPDAPWGSCDGTSPYDKNDGTVYVTGTQTGGDSGGTASSPTNPVLTDGSKNWTTNQWIGYSVRNLTEGWSSIITANTANTLTVGQNLYTGILPYPYVWKPGDSYQITRSTLCLDQPGAGTSGLISGANPTAPAGFSQIVDPIYVWGNTYTGSSSNIVGAATPNIVQGVDYFSGVARPGYSPYQCPNPLVNSGFTGDSTANTSYCSGAASISISSPIPSSVPAPASTPTPAQTTIPPTQPTSQNPASTVLTTEPTLPTTPIPPTVIVPTVVAPTTSTAFSFRRSLTVGMTGTDVKVLQQFLNSHGFVVAQSGNGSPGHESDYFGAATQRALARFQAANRITPASGYFGPKTIAVVEKMMH